ncbi:MAG: hypothetical protein IPM79_26730 [Polyangiaceae bacterium]|nr:hypothetical protein [Polyangiaceae bacterium]
MRRWLFATLLAVGCGAEPKPLSAPVPVGDPGATERRPLESVQRPDVVRSFPMDYAAIPHLVAQPLSPDDEKARVGFASVSSLGDARVSHDLIVEIEAGGLRAFTAEPLAGARLDGAACADLRRAQGRRERLVGGLLADDVDRRVHRLRAL